MTKIKLFVATVAAATFCAAANAQVESSTESVTKSAGETVSGWFDKLSESVKEIGKKSAEYTDDAQAYTQQLKDKWPSLKEQFSNSWNEGLQKGSEGKQAVQKWMDETFSKERMQSAEKWLSDFKNGVEDKVVDPLVPYILSIRYPNPMDEWNQGYKRLFPVQIQGLDSPLEVTLPLSWNLSQDLSLGANEFMSWRSESGNGRYVVALLTTQNGATVDSIVAGLQKSHPEAKTEKLEGSDIVKVTVLASGETGNPVAYYAVPAGGKAFLVCGEVLRSKGESSQSINDALTANSEFFNTVAKNIFVKPAV